MTTATIEETSTTTATKTTLMLPLAKLQQALGVVTLAVERKSTIPVLASVKVDEQDGFVDFSATNLEIAARCRVTLPEAKEQRSFLLPGLKLEAFAKLLQGDTVKVTCHDERRATLQCGRSTTRLPLQSTASFPRIVVQDGETGIEIDQTVADRMLHFTGFAISTEESRYTLSGALLELSGGKLHIVATDGHRLARYTVPTDETDRFPMLLPHGLVRVVEKVLGSGSGPLKLDGDDQNTYANLEGDGFSIALAHRKMTGQFPNYKAIMPPSSVVTVTVDAEVILHALRRCRTFADDGSGAVNVTIAPDQIVLRGANADTGETDETIDVHTSGEFERFKTGFNVDYLLDAFSRLKGDVEIRFSAANAQNAAMIVASPAEGETFEYVVMPMRV